jgi:UDP-N-acetylglucosamine enolpyruvyl transferase
MAETYTIENISQEKLDAGLAKLRDSGFAVEGNDVKGMGVEANFMLNGSTLTVTVEKHPPFLSGMIEKQIRGFFA